MTLPRRSRFPLIRTVFLAGRPIRPERAYSFTLAHRRMGIREETSYVCGIIEVVGIRPVPASLSEISSDSNPAAATP